MSIKNTIIQLADKIPFGLRSSIKNIPGLKQLQSFLLRKWVDNSFFVATISGGPAKGLVFPVHMPHDKMMWLGTWELDFALAMQKIVKPGWVCYDIGGYKGYYSGVMALAGAKEVYVFEPLPSNIEKVEELIALNVDLPIRLKKYAVSDKTGLATFKIMQEETMGKLENSTFQSGDHAKNEVQVNCITLDDLIKDGIPEPDFIKIDVEGAEEFVLKGASELLHRKKPFLMIEVHSPEIGEKCVELLKPCYSKITVLETGLTPDKGTPQICHYIATN